MARSPVAATALRSKMLAELLNDDAPIAGRPPSAYVRASRRDQVARRLEHAAQLAELQLDTWLTHVELPETHTREIRAASGALRDVAARLRKSAVRQRREWREKENAKRG